MGGSGAHRISGEQPQPGDLSSTVGLREKAPLDQWKNGGNIGDLTGSNGILMERDGNSMYLALVFWMNFW